MLMLGRSKAVVIRMAGMQSWTGHSKHCSLPRESTSPKFYAVGEGNLSIEEEKPGGKELGL